MPQVVDNKTTITQMNKAELFKREPPQPRDADLRQQIADKQAPMLAEISEACNALLRVQDHQVWAFQQLPLPLPPPGGKPCHRQQLPLPS